MDHSTAGFTTSNLTLPHSEQLDKALASMLPIEGQQFMELGSNSKRIGKYIIPERQIDPPNITS